MRFTLVLFLSLLSSPQGLPAQSMEGVWVNTDPDTNSIPKIEIFSTQGAPQLHWWGKTGAVDRRYGPLALAMLGDSVSDSAPSSAAYTTQDSGFADKVFLLRQEGANLVLDKVTIFKDDSGRTSFYDRAVFVKQAKPDLVLSSVSAHVTTSGQIGYSFTISNAGNGPVDLRGTPGEIHGTLSVQAVVSKDTLFRNEDDAPAGGTVVRLPASGVLSAGDSLEGSFQASVRDSLSEFTYLVFKVDWEEKVSESNEVNNLAVVGIASQAGQVDQPSAVAFESFDPQDLKIIDARIEGGPFVSGQTVIIKYWISNRSDKEVRWPKGARGGRQHWIERRGDIKEIPSRTSSKRVYDRYAAGGAMLLPLEAGVSQPFQQRLSTADLPVGEYTYHIEYKIGNKSIQTVGIDFEIIEEDRDPR